MIIKILSVCTNVQVSCVRLKSPVNIGRNTLLFSNKILRFFKRLIRYILITLIFLPKFRFAFLVLYLESFSLRISLDNFPNIWGCPIGDWMMLTLPLPRVCHKNSLSMTKPYPVEWPETSKHFLVCILRRRTNIQVFMPDIILQYFN